uniref:Glyco_hydro_2_C domain-containing protein n=1 Tax=Toxocara canis TaxID=6265 RepID=A0A183TWZ2_TOXCA
LFQEPSRDFSEQYQNDLLDRTHTAFDILRINKTIAGEMIWNFADFMTAQDVTRAVGNHKGVLTRTRQTKMAAYTLKRRYEKLSLEEQLSVFKTTTPSSVSSSYRDLIIPSKATSQEITDTDSYALTDVT